MKGNIYGYARVSSRDQNEARQLQALEAFGVPPGNVYTDKQSGKDFDRPAYKRLMRKLRPGDTLAIKSIDRLGRNYDEILTQWRTITKVKHAYIVALDMPLLDTRRDNDLTGTLIADIVLQLLSYVAQVERDFIRQRQAEGIAVAMQNGTRFGRRPSPRPAEFEACLREWQDGTLSARQAGKRLGVHHSTFINWISNMEGGDKRKENREKIIKKCRKK